MRKIHVTWLSALGIALLVSTSVFAAGGTCDAKAGTCSASGAEGCCAASQGSCAAKDGKACCAAAKAPAGPAELTGKVEAKTEKGADGKEVTSCYVTVSDAKCAAGKECAQMKGKTVKLTGSKAAEAQKLAGKQVAVKGTCGSACTEFDVASVTEKK